MKQVCCIGWSKSLSGDGKQGYGNGSVEKVCGRVEMICSVGTT